MLSMTEMMEHDDQSKNNLNANNSMKCYIQQQRVNVTNRWRDAVIKLY